MSEQSVDRERVVDEVEARAVIRRERLLLLMLASVQFTSIVDFMIIMPLGPQLMRALKIDPPRFGLIVSSYTIAAGVVGLLASSVLDRYGRKSAFLTLYTGFLLGTLLCGLATTYSGLLAARILTGAFGGIMGGMALAIIGDVIPEHRRGRATGVLMSAFACASVVGVPVGLSLGTAYGWETPFLILAGLGAPILLVAARVMPPLRDHLENATRVSPLKKLGETFSRPNHLRAFALTVTMMLGGFAVIPYISVYFVANVGVTEEELPWVYVVGGLLTLFGAPIIGKLADRFGKLQVFRIVAGVSALFMLVLTNLPPVGLAVATAVSGLLMVSNAGRMVAAMAMITGSVEPARRGGFMSANSAVQHMSTGLGAYIGGLLLAEAADHRLLHFNRVGYIAVASTLLSIWFAGRVRPSNWRPAREAPAAESTMVEETQALASR